MKVALVFDKHRDDTVGVYVERACQSLGLDARHWWARDADTIPAGYDLYVRIDHGDYKEDLPERCRPRVFWAMDTHLPHSWRKIRRLAARYDVVCCCHRDGADALPNGAWVPVACDAELHSPVTTERAWDVGFVGTTGGVPRKFVLQAVREVYPNSVIGHARHTELAAIYGRSRIGFNYSIRDDINMRMFEVMAAGALLVTNRLPHDDLSQLGLEEGRHYVAYGRVTEWQAVIDRYLADEPARATIAEAGRRAVLDRHTYRHRLEQILAICRERLTLPATRPAAAAHQGDSL